ncbi:ADP-ribosylglycohydrolase [Verrucomicrobium sp. GAS474]|uniref:ADP-ribosylglycohydrolase family protein n=1 Tax=Verrucomicrobium sp. GAS474 TaxID=1882831 RepID=UPI00087BFB35|nr:ADP-ribosylglycohydrolase family protein [Verrucomicrobium sp. GAS474]SDT98897.1 ADP-ribosylglycohydrolase [Verrucomicrobium sp. GAS474]
MISLESRSYGGWLGKSIGGTLGLPAEGKTERQHYRFYDPVPTVAPPNDDLELQLVWLDRMENHRGPLTIETIADAWLSHIHYMWDEYGRCRWNLRRGVPAALAGVYENPFASGMGSPIRSEVWAIVAAGKPDLAEAFARLDSMIDHGAEGVAGEVFIAVLQSLLLDGVGLDEGIEEALKRVDPATETRQAFDLLFHLHRQGVECWTARERLLAAHHSDNFTHAPLNVALTFWALLYGAGDFEATVLLGVNGGYDTDCTAATAGAILGMLHGAERLPQKWIAPIGDSVEVGAGIVGIRAPQSLQELTARSLALRSRAEELAPRFPSAPTALPSLASLPGTVSFTGGNALVPWANGELPGEIKANGGGTIEWKPGADLGKPFRLVALARSGCRLRVDGKVVVDCPAGVPYVPATHRSAEGSFATFVPTQASHEVKIELNAANPFQEATLLLADASLHIAPWSGEILAFRATLPAAF